MAEFRKGVKVKEPPDNMLRWDSISDKNLVKISYVVNRESYEPTAMRLVEYSMLGWISQKGSQNLVRV